MTAALRVIAYAPNGASKGPVPTPQDVSAGYPLNDVGAMTMTYPPDAARSDLLGQPLELAVETSWDGGVTWTEPPSSRFLYLRDGRDPIKTGDAFQVEGAAYILRLDKALVGLTGLNGEGNREFLNKTPGDILLTLWNEAQARGALTGMTASWTAAAGTGGTAWPSTIPQVAYEPGKSLLAILLEMADQGYVDFRTQGRTVQVYVAGAAAGMAADRTTGANPVSLRKGRDLTEAPFRRTWEGLADTAIVRGDNNSSLERTNAGAIAPWGRQETYVTASGVDDAGTLQVIADAALTLTAAERTEWTYGLDFGNAAAYPFQNYAPGEYVLAAVDGNAPQRMRVRQVTLTRDSNGAVAGNVVLNDRFLEADVLTARRLNQLTQGATQGGTGTAPSTTTTTSGVGNDILAPAQVGVVAKSSNAYVLADGTVRAQITLDWPDVTTNADGTVASDVDHYEVQKRVTGQTEWKDAGTRILSTWSDSPYNPGDSWDFRVRAVDTVFNRGAWSATVTQVAAADTVGPGKPSTPTATSRLGVAQIAWNGLRDTGAAMDSDFAYCAVHVSTVSGFTPTSATKVGELLGPAYAVAGPLTYGTTYYARLVPYDTSKNAGTVSDQVAFTIAPLVDVSNFPDSAMSDLYARTGHFLVLTADNFSANLIKGMWIDAGTITAEKLAISDFTDYAADWSEQAVRDATALPSFASWDYSAADPFPWRLRYNGSITGYLSTAVGPRAATVAGEKFHIKVDVYRSSGGYNGFIGFNGYDANGAYVNLSLNNMSVSFNATMAAGVWTTMEADVTVPANVVSVTPVILHNNSGTDTGDYYFRGLSIRRRIPDSQITEVGAGKIKTGLLQATEKIVAGGALSSGARVELSGAGLKAYDAAGNTTVDIAAATGAATFTGTIRTGFTGARLELAINPTYAAGGGGLILFQGDEANWDPGIVYQSSPGPGLMQTLFQGTRYKGAGGAASPPQVALLTGTGGTRQVNLGGSTIILGSSAEPTSATVWGSLHTTSTLTADAAINAAGTVTGGSLASNGEVHGGGAVRANENGAGAGLVDTTLATGSNTGANINGNGRVVRTSTRDMKHSLKPMTREEAFSVLGLESYTGKFRKDKYDDFADPARHPFFIAEQAAEAGAELWVARQHDVWRDPKTKKLRVKRNPDGKPIAFRTESVTVAHNYLIKDLYRQIEDLKADLAKLTE